jgi:hypothetical protein
VYQCTKCGGTTPELVPLGTQTINSQTVAIWGCAQMRFPGAVNYSPAATLTDSAGLAYMIPSSCETAINTANGAQTAQKIHIPSFSAGTKD